MLIFYQPPNLPPKSRFASHFEPHTKRQKKVNAKSIARKHARKHTHRKSKTTTNGAAPIFQRCHNKHLCVVCWCVYFFLCAPNSRLSLSLYVWVYIFTFQTLNCIFGQQKQINIFARLLVHIHYFALFLLQIHCMWLWIVVNSCWIEIGRSGPSKWIGMMNVFVKMRLGERESGRERSVSSVPSIFSVFIMLCVCVFVCQFHPSRFVFVFIFSTISVGFFAFRKHCIMGCRHHHHHHHRNHLIKIDSEWREKKNQPEISSNADSIKTFCGRKGNGNSANGTTNSTEKEI